MRRALLALAFVPLLAASAGATPPPPVSVQDEPCSDYYQNKIALSPVFICIYGEIDVP